MPAAKKVNLKALRALARIGASDKQLCHFFHLSQDTLAKRFRAEIDSARAEGGLWALQRAHERAERGCWPAIECLLTHLCGWTRSHAEQQQVINIVQNNAAPAQFSAVEFRQRYELAQRFLEQHKAELQNNGNRQGQRALPRV